MRMRPRPASGPGRRPHDGRPKPASAVRVARAASLPNTAATMPYHALRSKPG